VPPSRLLLPAALLLAACSSSPASPPPVDTAASGRAALADPFVGTGDSSSPNPVTNGSGGSTFPGAALPFGMVQWGPDTPNATPSGYHFGDGVLTGLSLTHLNGAGCSAKRDFPVFPVTGAWDPTVEPSDAFTHDAEIASPGFYEVTLKSGIRVDLTATARTGLARFTFPVGAPAHVLVSGGWLEDTAEVSGFSATIAADGTITGQRTDSFFCATAASYAVYFAARFDQPFLESGTWSESAQSPGATTVSGPQAGAYAAFDTTKSRVVQMKVGLSYVSEAGALANLTAESPGWDFDAVHAAAVARWNGYFDRVAVEGGSTADQTAFYSALYHVLLQPGVASDVSGAHVGLDGKVVEGSARTRYADYSGWDIYRSWVPLAAVVAPDETADMMQTLVDSGGECGALPRWALESTDTGIMVGDPADVILASAYAFLGPGRFDAASALSAMVKGATDTSVSCNGYTRRLGLADYLAKGYCPIDGASPPDGPTATTLEYAAADFAISRLASALGDTTDAATFGARGQNWKNVFDPSLQGLGFTGFMAPRASQDQNGMPAFTAIDPSSGDGFVEGNAAQYTFCVPHDMPGLIAALGGDATAIARLDAFFTQLNAGVSLPYHYQGNEPGFSIPWAYPFAGAPWRTQDVVRRILTQAYGPGPTGLPGNDDLGAMSSWQVWAMLGLYPAVPGVSGFVLGSPTFPKVTITIGGDPTDTSRQIVITAEGAATASPYVQSLSVGGMPSTSTWLPWETVSSGGTLDFSLGPSPSTWGGGAGDRPPSFYP
jgi:predicted alpha-1,2-mannosidase